MLNRVERDRLRGAIPACGTLQPGTIPATLFPMTIQVNLPDDLVARIDDLSSDRSEFVAEAVRKALRESETATNEHEVARINEIADELNREAEDVLEYQVLA
jgi:Arc/MetJ-type ribon-helix-helix transcriptional regulator